MRRLVISVLAMTLLTVSPAMAHQPVSLLDSDTTAAKGPLLTDGTISFAVRASFTKAGQKKAFRATLKAGDQLALQYLILDKKPENATKIALLPQVSVVAPSGAKFTMKINERTKFFEPFSRTNYLYLSRYTGAAEAGTYSITISSRTKSAITLAIGEREVTGDVIRGAAPTPSKSASPSATATPTTAPTAAPTAAPTKSATPSATKAGYTLADLKEHNSAASCWSAISGNVYDLTTWISSHPGGSSAIKGICGIDGTSAFNGQHRGDSNPTQRLASFLKGPLTQ